MINMGIAPTNYRRIQKNPFSTSYGDRGSLEDEVEALKRKKEEEEEEARRKALLKMKSFGGS